MADSSNSDDARVELPPLASLRAFEAAGRQMNFTKAAEELGMTTGAISQHIRILEAYAGKRLFIRHGRGVELTATGQLALEEIAHALVHVARAGAILRHADIKTLEVFRPEAPVADATSHRDDGDA